MTPEELKNINDEVDGFLKELEKRSNLNGHKITHYDRCVKIEDNKRVVFVSRETYEALNESLKNALNNAIKKQAKNNG